MVSEYTIPVILYVQTHKYLSQVSLTCMLRFALLREWELVTKADFDYLSDSMAESVPRQFRVPVVDYIKYLCVLGFSAL